VPRRPFVRRPGLQGLQQRRRRLALRLPPQQVQQRLQAGCAPHPAQLVLKVLQQQHAALGMHTLATALQAAGERVEEEEAHRRQPVHQKAELQAGQGVSCSVLRQRRQQGVPSIWSVEKWQVALEGRYETLGLPAGSGR
jgi:hypothetical protein